MIANMRARLIDEQKAKFSDGTIVEYVIWELPAPVLGSDHLYKYRFFFGMSGTRLIGYDNERGKGDHRHVGNKEEPYQFAGLGRLIEDFEREVAGYRATRANTHD